MFVNNLHIVQDTSAMCWSVKTFEYYEAVGKRTCAKAWLFHSFSVTSFLIVLNFSKLLYNGKAVELTVNLLYLFLSRMVVVTVSRLRGWNGSV